MQHASFASSHPGEKPFGSIGLGHGQQVLWPDRCVQGTSGAGFHPDLGPAIDQANLILRQGTHPAVDSYSAFFENDKVTSTGLAGYLRDRRLRRCVFVGLAYDFRVAWSAQDAARLGFEAAVLKPLTRAIAMPAAEGQTTMDEVEADFPGTGIVVVA